MTRKTSELLLWLGVASGAACGLGAIVAASLLAQGVSGSLNLGMLVLIVSLPMAWGWVVWRWRSGR